MERRGAAWRGRTEKGLVGAGRKRAGERPLFGQTRASVSRWGTQGTSLLQRPSAESFQDESR